MSPPHTLVYFMGEILAGRNLRRFRGFPGNPRYLLGSQIREDKSHSKHTVAFASEQI